MLKLFWRRYKITVPYNELKNKVTAKKCSNFYSNFLLPFFKSSKFNDFMGYCYYILTRLVPSLKNPAQCKLRGVFLCRKQTHKFTFLKHERVKSPRYQSTETPAWPLPNYSKILLTNSANLPPQIQTLENRALLIKNSIQMPIALKHQKANGIK